MEPHVFVHSVAAPSGRGFLLSGTGLKEECVLENRLSVISIIVEDTSVSGEVNELLHAFGTYIVGRMGVPYKERGVSIICVVLDAPADVTSALSGKLGMLRGVSTKTIVAKQQKSV